MSAEASPPTSPVPVPERLSAQVPLPGPQSAWSRWLHHGGTPEEASHLHDHTRPWYAVLWLTGVDYFSTLGYQPGIALLAAGVISPFATAILVLFTLFGALPVYREVASRSFIGQGSIAMLESVFSGWRSKLVVLVMLGFASTAFIVTVTISAADAAHHIVENPLVERFLHGGQMWVTLILMALLAAVFLKGFSEAIGLAVGVGLPYLLLNLVVVGAGFMKVSGHPELLQNWTSALNAKGDWTALLVGAALAFPRLALGLSGFETGVAVMPLVRGEPSDTNSAVPWGRVKNSRRLLLTAALIMSVMLITTSFLTAVLVPASAYHEGGPAAGRVLSYLAHELLGHGFGTLYDVSTILILWFAGASAVTGMLNLVPRYLPRLGMAPRWVAYARPLVLVLLAAEVLVTLVFRADVEAQAGAYATGVLVLMFSGAVAVAIALGREAKERGQSAFTGSALYFWLVTLGFVYAIVENVRERPDGVWISAAFILFIIVLSVMSRYIRATELRVESVTIEDPDSVALWGQINCKKVNLVPLKHFDEPSMGWKTQEIRRHYRVDGPLAFLHVGLRDDRSDFASVLRVKVRKLGDQDFVIEVTGAVALANTIAYISELIDPISIFLGLTRQNSVGQAFRYLLWGEGETGILVYEILRRHWEWTPEEDVRPLIFIMSE
jgi:hypothetical protein